MFLVRLELPDRPGALGAVATALGTTGADIVSVDIVERRAGTAIDDFVIDLPPGVTPDALITSGQSVEGVNVHWVARYSAGGDALRDLEAVEAMTTDPVHAAATLTTLAPGVFMGDWALLVQADAPGGPKRHAPPAGPRPTCRRSWPTSPGRRRRCPRGSMVPAVVAGGRLDRPRRHHPGRPGRPPNWWWAARAVRSSSTPSSRGSATSPTSRSRSAGPSPTGVRRRLPTPCPEYVRYQRA